jgi:hypothetical protein
MNALDLPELLLRTGDHGDADAQQALALATQGVLRYVWEGRYGAMLIEVDGGEIRVNGKRVERFEGSQGY